MHLFMGNSSPGTIVAYHAQDGGLVALGSIEFHAVIPKGTVTNKNQHRLIRVGQFGSYSVRNLGPYWPFLPGPQVMARQAGLKDWISPEVYGTMPGHHDGLLRQSFLDLSYKTQRMDGLLH
jgi:hypothetical protein